MVGVIQNLYANSESVTVVVVCNFEVLAWNRGLSPFDGGPEHNASIVSESILLFEGKVLIIVCGGQINWRGRVGIVKMSHYGGACAHVAKPTKRTVPQPVIEAELQDVVIIFVVIGLGAKHLDRLTPPKICTIISCL